MKCYPALLVITMGNRLTKKRKLGIIGGGCVFAALVGLAFLTQGAEAAVVQSTTIANGGFIFGDSTVQWSASSWDMQNVPPLNCTQEILQGAYSSSATVRGGASYSSQYELNNTEIIVFTEQSKIHGSGIIEGSMLLDSYGAPSTGVLCNSMPEDTPMEGEEDDSGVYTTAYCEQVLSQSLFMGDNLQYQSIGVISQADDTMVDSFDIAMFGEGERGYGSMEFNAISLAGIGNTDMLGYTNRIGERFISGGDAGFDLGQEIHWSSFMYSFGNTHPAEAETSE